MDGIRESEIERLARKVNTKGVIIRPEKRLAIYIRDSFTCVYCGRSIKEHIVLSLDHLIPQSKGGDNSTANLITCCQSCNASRKTLPVSLFILTRENHRQIARAIARSVRKPLAKYLAKAKAMLVGKNISTVMSEMIKEG